MANVRRLPGPIADIWEWQIQGLCRGRDSMRSAGARSSSDSARRSAAIAGLS